MSVKTNVLKTLEKNRGSFFSGEDLANSLSVSRAAVWKAIKELQKEGYEITAIPNRGYSLDSDSDILSAEGIHTYLKSEYDKIPITVDKVTTSTNINAKVAAVSGAVHGTVFVAEEQSQGRGRRGRSFVSIKGKGIYMSMVLKPDLDAENLVLITTAASVAVHRAIAKVTGKKTQIKWVNDLYYHDHKVCGILTEAVSDCESGQIDSVIVGIGINYYFNRNNVPDELQDIVGALYEEEQPNVTRNQLIAEVVNELLAILEELLDRDYLKDYRENSMVIGKKIFVLSGSNKRKATAIGIEDNGGLLVEYEDGSHEVLCTGEVTIRLNEV